LCWDARLALGLEYDCVFFLSIIIDEIKVPEGKPSVPTFAIDYSNMDQITQTLNEQAVHTVISTIVMYDPVAAQAERTLIEAAAKSASVKRFVQSNWGDRTPEDEQVSHEMYRKDFRANIPRR
jgi:hypothetical protein